MSKQTLNLLEKCRELEKLCRENNLKTAKILQDIIKNAEKKLQEEKKSGIN